VDKLLAFLAIGRIFRIPKSTITDTISRYKNSNKNFYKLEEALQEECGKNPIRNLFESIPRRIEACMKTKDGQLNIKHL